MIVYAEDEDEAYQVVKNSSREVLMDVDSWDWEPPSQVELVQIGSDWVDSIPYGEDVNDRTCRVILKGTEEEKAARLEKEREKGIFDAHPSLEI